MKTWSIRVGMLLLLTVILAGCGGGSSSTASPGVGTSAPPPTSTPPPSLAGTGTLVLTLVDTEDRPLRDATVRVSMHSGSTLAIRDYLSTDGTATIGSLPAKVSVGVLHPWADLYFTRDIAVAQTGETTMRIVLQPSVLDTMAALLPVKVRAGSVSADGSELTLDVTTVASSKAPLKGELDATWPGATPSLGLSLAPAGDTPFDCLVWLDSARKTPDCGKNARTSPYRVSVDRFDHVRAGLVPTLAATMPASNVMLLLDQSARMIDRDPQTKRSFAARRMVERLIGTPSTRQVSIAGFSGNRTTPNAMSVLPRQPLWVATGSGTTWSSDRNSLFAAIDTLEPLLGGSAPVIDALGDAIDLASQASAPGSRMVVAMLGGGDDQLTDPVARAAAVAALRQKRIASGAQIVLIDGADLSKPDERDAIAEIANRVDAPLISLGTALDSDFNDTGLNWSGGAYGALDLAAQIAEGRPLETLSASFRVNADSAGKFRSGELLRGVIWIVGQCNDWLGACERIPLHFAVEIP